MPAAKKEDTVFTDNVEDAPQFKFCYQHRRRILNPIVDWTDDEVWEFIHEYNIPYCSLYDTGLKRIGCIGCPMSSRAASELKRYPKYKTLYLKAFEKMLQERKKAGLETEWQTAEEVLDWWLGDKK